MVVTSWTAGVGGWWYNPLLFFTLKKKKGFPLLYHRDLGLGLVSSTQVVVGFIFVWVWKFFLPDCDPHACGIIVRHCCCCCCNFWLQGWLANTRRRRPTEPRKHMYTSRFWFIIMQTASKICKKKLPLFSLSSVTDELLFKTLKGYSNIEYDFTMCHGTTAPTVGLTK